MFSLTCALIDGWENIREAGDLTHHRAHYDVFVIVPMICSRTYITVSFISQARDEKGNILRDKDGKAIMRKVGTIKKGKKKVSHARRKHIRS